MIKVLKYNDVKQKLLRYVFENRLKEGAKLPSERKLCTLFGTSNLPLRRAEDELCEGGMLRREKNRGVFVGKNWDRANYSTRLGILSVGVNDYPSGPAEETLRNALREHLCDLRVVRTSGIDISSVAIHELERCDYIIISGFITPAWVEAVKALEKPIMHIGCTELETGIPRVENDFQDMYEKILELAGKLKAKRVLVWMSPKDELTYARSMEKGLELAAKKCGCDRSSIICERITARDIIHGLKSLRKHKNDFDMLVLRDYTLGMLVFHPEWSKLIGGRPVAVINTSKQFPNDFDMLPNVYRFSFQMSLIPMAIDFFFVHHNRLPGGVMVKRCKATLAEKSIRADYWGA